MNLNLQDEDTYEAVSGGQHEIWSSWMKFMFGIGTFNADGSWTMPAQKVRKWIKQMDTPYKELAEEEKDGDREQVDKIIETLG